MPQFEDLPVTVRQDIIKMASTPTRKPRKSIAHLATVNSFWQGVVEETSFRHLIMGKRVIVGKNLTVGKNDPEQMMAVLRRRPARFGLVRKLTFAIVLPDYCFHKTFDAETENEKSINNVKFSESLAYIFKLLAKWPATGRSLELELNPFSPNDGGIFHWRRRNHPGYNHHIPCDMNFTIQIRTFDSILDCDELKLALAPAVTKIILRDNNRFISAAGISTLFTACTNLRDADIRFWDYYKNRPAGFRAYHRRSMAEAFKRMPATVTSMNFLVEYRTPANQRPNAPSVGEDNEKPDPLTVAYRKATEQMVVVHARGMLGTPELFWPSKVTAENPVPQWNKLQYMVLYYHIHDPAGEYLFVGDKSSTPRIQCEKSMFEEFHWGLLAEEDRNPFQNRYTADQYKLDDFYCAVGNAVGNMPVLRRLRTQALTYWDDVLKPYHIFEIEIHGRHATVTWTSKPVFEPSDRVVKVWKKMAYERGLRISFESRAPVEDEDEEDSD